MSTTRLRLTVAAVAAALFVALYVGTNLTAWGQSVENGMLGGWYEDQTLIWLPYHDLRLPPLLQEVPTILIGIPLVTATALVRRRWRDAVLVAVATPVAIYGTKIFKDLFGRPHLVDSRDLDPSYPSGHFTVAAALTLALLIAVPRRWVPWLAVPLLGWTALIGSGVQALGWHRPSDVLGGALLVTLVFLVVGAVVSATQPGATAERTPIGAGTALALVSVVAVLALAGAVTPIGWRLPIVAGSSILATAAVGWAALRLCRTQPAAPSSGSSGSGSGASLSQTRSRPSTVSTAA